MILNKLKIQPTVMATFKNLSNQKKIDMIPQKEEECLILWGQFFLEESVGMCFYFFQKLLCFEKKTFNYEKEQRKGKESVSSWDQYYKTSLISRLEQCPFS